MFGLFKKIKHSLTHINKESWHYKIAELRFFLINQKKPVRTQKTCSYWWGRFFGGMLLLIFVAPFFLVLLLISGTLLFTVAWLLGYRFYNPEKEEEYVEANLGTRKIEENYRGERTFYPRKFNPKKRTYDRLVPAQYFLTGALVVLLAYGAIWHTFFLLETISVLVVLGLIFFIIFYAFSKGWRTYANSKTRDSFQGWWDKVCPDLVVERESESISTSQH